MTPDIFIPILLGAARKNSFSEKAAHFVLGEAVSSGKFGTELVDLKNFSLFRATEGLPSEEKENWRGLMSRADGLIIITPEYNHGFPGELKIFLDELYNEYARKPIGICGVSAGIAGGIRAVEALRLVAIELHMIPIPSAVYFRNVEELFDESGAIKDWAYSRRLNEFFEEILWYACILKSGRKN